MTVWPYLHFAGACEAALTFYQSVFGETLTLHRYAGTPMEADMPPRWSEKIMHARFESEPVKLLAADAPNERPPAQRARIHLAVVAADHAEGLRAFEALAGGTVTLPYEPRFWGASFGMLVDRFDIPWMINAG